MRNRPKAKRRRDGKTERENTGKGKKNREDVGAK
jgi:hypothetical protein